MSDVFSQAGMERVTDQSRALWLILPGELIFSFQLSFSSHFSLAKHERAQVEPRERAGIHAGLCSWTGFSTFSVQVLPAGQLSSVGSDSVGRIVDYMVHEDLVRCLHEAPGWAGVCAQENRAGSGKTADLAWITSMSQAS